MLVVCHDVCMLHSVELASIGLLVEVLLIVVLLARTG